jgi:glycolate oxidase iron-sulfur subunit
MKEMMASDLRLLSTLDYKSKLNQCIHCGLCLQACPTYAILGEEMDAPRGRIALMRAASEGRIAPEQFGGALARHMALCLTCRACETACPSGVQYGALVETMRETIARLRKPGAAERFVRWLSLRQLLPHVRRLKLIARLLRLYEIAGLQRLVRAQGFLPKPLMAMEAILPPVVARYRDYRRPALALGENRGKVAFFIGCIQEAFLSPVNEATIRVLQRNGYEVHFPSRQTCCGAAHIHLGERDLARDLARQNIDAFLSADYDAIITNAGGCGAALEEYPDLMKDDPAFADKAKRFAAKVHDISEFLADHFRARPQGFIRARAAYSDSCHLRNVQKVSRQPRALLASIPGLELVELRQTELCCGSAGVYNIIQSETANAILDLKMADIAASQADLIVAANTGCHMQLLAGVRRAGLNARVMHIAQVLDLSYQSNPSG